MSVGVGGLGGFAADLTITGTGTVSFSAIVQTGGRETTAYFQYGLGTRYREPKPKRLVYDESTPVTHLGPGMGPQQVFGKASGLIPNAVYHVRLVAKSSTGTVRSQDSAFRTAGDPAPGPPRIGVTVNASPVSGLVLIQPLATRPSPAARVARLVEGDGFLPLTESRQLPIDAQFDARPGTVQVVAASPQSGQTQQLTLAGGVFSLTQARRGLDEGLPTVDLIEGAFPGAPSYADCGVRSSTDTSTSSARTAQSSSPVLETMHASDQTGQFRVHTRYSAATATGAGTAWDTIDRCDGTLTVVRRGTVIVSDLVLGGTAAVHAGQSYLARAR